MLDLTDIENRGVTFKKFCGLDAEDGVGCTEEAVGDITAELEDGVKIPVPVCEGHLQELIAAYNVEQVS
ncbi:hypothetical protein SEA_ANNADREAMY_102 [Streptomyces phage Annadreamy]|uniref:Uncharacterized protein n=3 Tax=Annadreamyvirus TaxID=2843347 RepID=A0A345GTE0_9CAUD|nr:hypothetical protein HWB75_gp151 [Streptomyces phage Annadreamy]YP_009839297.1 hypothetical protein HWB76_gp157 [Streptomyces phage Blueeyedbeauty]AXG66212.1 hypothetical protein SEA_ANNADREAMY_102 [Streptomyces phage Annadreamy]AXH49245.1 hypothetical protein SEA_BLUEEYEDBEAUTY_112 [Streptomyces phage Blueeyedbeauty]QGH79436.1 hypothetical protein SEA_LIMPID_111 [Streptomyces phage Limpid]